MDEGSFAVGSFEREISIPKRGRGAAGKKSVAIMAKSIHLKNLERNKPSKRYRYFKAKVLESHLKEGISQTVFDSIDEKSIVFTD
jgi:hypothetical protein